MTNGNPPAPGAGGAFPGRGIPVPPKGVPQGARYITGVGRGDPAI